MGRTDNSPANLRHEIVRIGRLMYDRGLVAGLSGNLSARSGPERLLVTPSGVAKGFLRPEHMLEVDLQGRLLDAEREANSGLRPTSELPMHLEVYRQRPDVGAVVHAHPTATIALSIAGIGLDRPVVPEAVVLLGEVPTAPYATPSTDEDRLAIRDLISHHDAIVLSHHGALTVGTDLWEAFLKLETLEAAAKIIAWAHVLGEPAELSPEQVDKLHALRQGLGFAAPSQPDRSSPDQAG